MRLHVKVGTMPAEYAEAMWLRKPPKEGDSFLLKREPRWGGLARVRVTVDQIKDLGGDLLYFVTMW